MLILRINFKVQSYYEKKLYFWFHGKLFEFNRLSFRLSTIQVSSAELPLAILIKAIGCVSGRIFTNEIMIPDALNFLFGGSFFGLSGFFPLSASLHCSFHVVSQVVRRSALSLGEQNLI